ncbi:MAG: hypothetical protein LQ342_001703 [Letrouitia transgressa]|nr:MAG: hypothetical protein LQ342_001703 [Letrouitia transgressa]
MEGAYGCVSYSTVDYKNQIIYSLSGTLPPRDVLRCRRERTIIDSDEITPVTISFYKSAVNRCTWTDNLENETRALPTRLPDSKEMHTLVGVSNDTTSQIPQEPLHVKECINASADQSTLLSLPSRLLQYQSHHGQKFQQFFGAVQYSFDETFVQTSIVHRLSPIHGIPGWKRITIVPLSIKARQGSIAEGVDLRSLANEDIIQIMQGVVLPGGKIILGRWWQHESDLKDAARSGPFILWNVPGRRGVRRARQEAKNMKKGQEEIVCYGNSKDALGDVLEGSFPFWL